MKEVEKMKNPEEKVEVIIKMSRKQYDIIKSDLYNTFPAETRKWGLEAIRNGVPIPEGHGKIVDVNEILLDATTVTTDDYSGNEVLDVVLKEDIDNVHAIIEADEVKESLEELEEDIER